MNESLNALNPRTYDLYWMSNRAWFDLKDPVPTIKVDASSEAKVIVQSSLFATSTHAPPWGATVIKHNKKFTHPMAKQ